MLKRKFYVPDLPKLQSIHDGLGSNIQSLTAYATGWAGLFWGLLQNHWLSIVSAICLISTALWNSRHKKQMIKQSEQIMKESKLRMQMLQQNQLSPDGEEVRFYGQGDRGNGA